MQGHVHSVDGILADIEECRVHKDIHIQCGVLGTAGSCGVTLKQKVNLLLITLTFSDQCSESIYLDSHYKTIINSQTVLPVVHKAGGAEGVSGFGTPAVCSLAG